MASAKPAFVDEEGLILFYHSQSFYCQKVLFALHEKGIPFRRYEIDVTSGEQFSDWFLELNAKGEVPLLKNGSLIIPVAAQIINYVETNFKGADIKDLLPVDGDEKNLKSILQFSRIISRLPIGAISKGAFAHATALNLNPKIPFIPPVRDALLNSNEKLIVTVKNYAEKSQNYRDVLVAKAEEYSKQTTSTIPNRAEFECILKKLDDLFTILESHLKNQRTIWFLSDSTTILDICFGILLHRLDMIGLDKRLWGEKPSITKYFQQIQNLESYQGAVPSQLSNLKALWSKLPDQYKYMGFGLISVSSLGLINLMKKMIL